MLLDDKSVIQCDHQNFGCGVAVIISNQLHPQELMINSTYEMVAAKICNCHVLIIISVYHSPTTPVADSTIEMLKIITQFNTTPMCIMGDLNGDVSKIANTYFCSLLQQNGLK